MIHTRLCDLLEIEHPIIQAGAGPATSAQLAAAVSNAGALGSIANFGLDHVVGHPDDFVALGKTQKRTDSQSY